MYIKIYINASKKSEKNRQTEAWPTWTTRRVAQVHLWRVAQAKTLIRLGRDATSTFGKPKYTAKLKLILPWLYRKLYVYTNVYFLSCIPYTMYVHSESNQQIFWSRRGKAWCVCLNERDQSMQLAFHRPPCISRSNAPFPKTNMETGHNQRHPVYTKKLPVPSPSTPHRRSAHAPSPVSPGFANGFERI